MTKTLRARKMKVDAVDAKTELLLRTVNAMQRKLLALQAITVELAARSNLSEGDSLTLATELAAAYPPEVAPSLREEIARLMQR